MADILKVALHGKRLRVTPGSEEAARKLTRAELLHKAGRESGWLESSLHRAATDPNLPLPRLAGRCGLSLQWDPLTISRLASYRRWWARHGMEYRAEVLNDQQEGVYKQGETIEDKFPELYEYWMAEILKRPYGSILDQLQVEDCARALMKEYGFIGHIQGTGKCLGRGTPVLMFDGTIKKVENVVVGDLLMGPDSKPRKVLTTTHGTGEMFNIEPEYGDPYAVNADHILVLANLKSKEVLDVPLSKYLQLSDDQRDDLVGVKSGRVTFTPSDLPLPLEPYFLGAWLGDGSEGQPVITGDFEENAELVAYLKGYASRVGAELSPQNVKGRPGRWTIVFEENAHRFGPQKVNPIRDALGALGILYDKRIPHAYKVATPQARLELLAGLLDTDGELRHQRGNATAGYTIMQKRRLLAEDIAFVALSLGFRAHVMDFWKKQRDGRLLRYWRVGITGDVSEIPLKIARKRAPRLHKWLRNPLHMPLKQVSPLGSGEYYGFTITGDGRFLLGDFTVTHNTIMYGVLSDVLHNQKVESLKGYAPERTADGAFSLIVCEGKSVWDVRDMLKTVLGLDAAIIERPRDIERPEYIHIVSYDKLSGRRERWEKQECESCKQIVSDRPYCAKCGSPHPFRLPGKEGSYIEYHRPGKVVSLIPQEDGKLAAAGCDCRGRSRVCEHLRFQRDKMTWAMRDLELRTMQSGRHKALIKPGSTSVRDLDTEMAQKFPPNMLWHDLGLAKHMQDRYRLVILDESFLIKNRLTHRAKAISLLRPRRRFIGTGTATDGVAIDTFNQFGWLCGFNSPLFPYKRTGLDQFKQDFCELKLHRTSTGNKTKRLTNRTDEPATKKWFNLLYRLMIRRTVVKDLPPVHHRVVEIPLDAYDRLFYATFLSDFATQFAALQQRALIENEGVIDERDVRSQMWCLRAAISAPNSPKLKLLAEYKRALGTKQRVCLMKAQEIAGAGEKLVIFAGIPEACHQLQNVFADNGVGSVVLTGEDNPKQRQQLISTWRRATDLPALICSMMAESTARTFTEANHVIFLDIDWSPRTVEQCWKRVHRRGQTKETTVDYLVCDDTVDQVMYELVVMKQKAASRAIDRLEASTLATKIDAIEAAMLVLAAQGTFEIEVRKVQEFGFDAIEDIDLSGTLARRVQESEIFV